MKKNGLFQKLNIEMVRMKYLRIVQKKMHDGIEKHIN